jgi:catechol 2,3-dioxygenase-like lactoylglutathione lyase family enzyme
MNTSTNVNLSEVVMSRVQLALNVGDLDEAIAFYTKLFQTGPAKVREGYANFAIANPPLKLVLIAGAGVPGTMNHVGVEVETTEEVAEAIVRFQAEDMPTEVQDNTACCFALQDKVWVEGPDIAWEIYTVLGDAPAMACTPGSVPTVGTVGVVGAMGTGPEARPALIPLASASACC